jgi:hypothetical protein
MCAAFQRVCKSSAVALCIVYVAGARIVINLYEFTVAPVPITNRSTIYKREKFLRMGSILNRTRVCRTHAEERLGEIDPVLEALARK